MNRLGLGLRSLHTVKVARPIKPSTVHVPLSYFPKPEAEEQEKNLLVPLPSSVFDVPYRYDILHECVRNHLAGLRQSSAHSKKRWEVRGSTRKLRPQKHTGKARVGDNRSPTRVGGGVVHGPRNTKVWAYHIPNKVSDLGMRNALSLKWRFGDLMVIDRVRWPFDLYSTRQLNKMLEERGLIDSTFIVRHAGHAFHRSVANIPLVDVFSPSTMNSYSILRNKKLVIDLFSLQDIFNTYTPPEFTIGSFDPVLSEIKQNLQKELDNGIVPSDPPEFDQDLFLDNDLLDQQQQQFDEHIINSEASRLIQSYNNPSPPSSQL